MRENWTYKKLGEVTTTINGLWTGKKPPFINVAVVRNTNFTKDCKLDMTNVAYLDVELKQYNSRKLLPGDIIIEKSGGSDKQPVGRPVLFDIPDGEYSFSNFTSTLRINNADEIIPQFLHCALYSAYLRGETFKLQSKTTGIHNLDFKGYNRLPIPIPSLSEQQSIVAELDKINELISLKKAQLSDLDNLAQSIFYDMFGDPIENEKGWEKKKYEDICLIITDGEHSTPKRESNGIFLLSARNIHNHRLELQDVDYIGEDEYNRVSKRIIPQAKDILISCSGSVGRVCSVPDDIKFQMVRSVALLRLKSHMNNVFFEYLISSDFTQEQITKAKTNSAQANLFQGRIKNLIAIVPPLSLQQDFAKRIELIEQQKAQISSTIKDLETLLASRMQYWFD